MGAMPVLLLALLIVQCCRAQDAKGKPVIKKEEREKASSYKGYEEDEIIIAFKEGEYQVSKARIKAELARSGINRVDIRQCGNCGSYVELWKAKDIHNVIHSEGVGGGAAGSSKDVGEDTIAYYSRNFISKLPVEYVPVLPWESGHFRAETSFRPIDGAGRDTIVIAVLDTGIDTVQFQLAHFLWTNKAERPVLSDRDVSCYPGDIRGWNFVDKNANIRDDNKGRHGSLVSGYIAEAFSTAQFSRNFVQIMTLKTHDKDGNGDLFDCICAIHYAKEMKARIINASWGFYYYDTIPHPYLTKLITEVLPEAGILFIAAAGNEMRDVDEKARLDRKVPADSLRDLGHHKFYPACLSGDANSVITVTTTDGSSVSPAQNYSARYVDLGVKADRVRGRRMEFLGPFIFYPAGEQEYVRGSSFAAAIATGQIGAFLPRTVDNAQGNTKGKVMQALMDIPGIVTKEPPLADKNYIRGGKFIKHKQP